MLSPAHLPPAILRVEVTFWAADAEFDHDRVSLNSKGWVGKVTFGPRIRGSSWVTYGIANVSP